MGGNNVTAYALDSLFKTRNISFLVFYSLFVFFKNLNNCRVGYNDYSWCFWYDNFTSDHFRIDKETYEGYYLIPFIGELNF